MCLRERQGMISKVFLWKEIKFLHRHQADEQLPLFQMIDHLHGKELKMMLVSGIVMDAAAGERQNMGFTLNGSMILLLVLLNAWAFSCMKEPRLGEINADKVKGIPSSSS